MVELEDGPSPSPLIDRFPGHLPFFNYVYCVEVNGRTICEILNVNDLACFVILPRHSSGETEKYHENHDY